MIKSATFKFLKEVSENNDRDWFKLHKNEYDNALQNVLDFTAALITALSKTDPTVPANLDPKACVMRIYRDVRFSKDKVPYKTNFGIAISANGKNFKGPGYYIHLQPGASFIAAGSWFPEKEELKCIRQEIDYNASDWHEIIDDTDFKKLFGDLHQEGKLQTAPKGYDADNPEIEYLKLKSFTVGKKLTDKELTASGSVESVASLFEKLYPFIIFLRSAIS
ncbi:DUF2461 domain-containing protein [Desertivirga xinjiangensis]|uniref:DUF2461 domain-containing protein n=1 Tax=Desertivirga xinjiangensis TaxID=539206 RepID=UPI00210E86FF|nr:DUF2461 domain-containing protein [Pedobacter xinjiangensis]